MGQVGYQPTGRGCVKLVLQALLLAFWNCDRKEQSDSESVVETLANGRLSYDTIDALSGGLCFSLGNDSTINAKRGERARILRGKGHADALRSEGLTTSAC